MAIFFQGGIPPIIDFRLTKYDNIDLMLTEQEKQFTDQVICVLDASDDPNLEFLVSETRRQAYYVYKGSGTENLENDYLLFASPYTISQGASDIDPDTEIYNDIDDLISNQNEQEKGEQYFVIDATDFGIEGSALVLYLGTIVGDDTDYLVLSTNEPFETTSQLNTRDTNNRNRANHTGTQLASTISDFATKAIEAVVQPIKVSGSFTVTPAHNNCTIKVSGTTPTITFDTATQAYPSKFSVYFLKMDATDATFVFTGAGWTYTYDNLTLAGEGGRCGVLKFDGDNELILLGNE